MKQKIIVDFCGYSEYEIDDDRDLSQCESDEIFDIIQDLWPDNTEYVSHQITEVTNAESK